MTKVVLSIALFFKRVSIIGRIIFIGGTVLTFDMLVLPDAKFNMALSNPKEMSIEELVTTPKDDIPRYIKIKDAMLIRLPIDSVSTGYRYVLSNRVNKKSNKATLDYIIYPVFSAKAVESNKENGSDSLVAQVLIRDTKVTEKELKGDEYFKDSQFSIEGQYDFDRTEWAAIERLRKIGYKVAQARNVIILNKGIQPMGWQGLIIIGFIGIFLSTFSILSFVSAQTLQNYLDPKHE